MRAAVHRPFDLEKELEAIIDADPECIGASASDFAESVQQTNGPENEGSNRGKTQDAGQCAKASEDAARLRDPV